jgi:hypothetical protein
LIDATISELRLEVEDRDNFFGSVLKAARGGRIAVDSAHRPTFVAICAALWNSELCQSTGHFYSHIFSNFRVDRN